MDNQTNLMANISAGSGVLLFILYFVGVCIGMIPILGLLAIVLYPIDWLLAFVAIITGALGLKAAGEMGGTGQPQAIIGIVAGVMFLILQAVMICLMGGVGTLMILSEM